MRKKAFAKKILIALGRNEVDFIHKLEKDAFFSTGSKLSKSEIISAAIDILHDLNVSGQGAHNRKELEKNILSQINYMNKNKH